MQDWSQIASREYFKKKHKEQTRSLLEWFGDSFGLSPSFCFGRDYSPVDL